jgi:ankyrin repeat protein
MNAAKARVEEYEKAKAAHKIHSEVEAKQNENSKKKKKKQQISQQSSSGVSAEQTPVLATGSYPHSDGWFDLEDFYLQQTIYFHPGKLTKDPNRFTVDEVAAGAKMTAYCVQIAWKRPYETPEETKARLNMEAEAEQKRLDLGLLACGRIGDVQEAKQWIRKGASPRAKDERVGLELAHFAAAQGLMNVLFWLTNECDIKLAYVRDTFGATALHHAAKNGRVNVMEYLVNKCQVDPNESDSRGRTPLLYASHGVHLACIRWLCEECSVDVSHEDISGCTAAHRAVTSPICHQDVERVNAVLAYLAGEGLNMEEDDHWGWTPIDKAASCNNIRIVNELRRHGCNPTVGKFPGKNPDKIEGWGPTHKAGILGEAERLRWLHKRGVDLNVPDKRMETPLHHACAGGHYEAVQTLLRCGVNTLGKNNIGQTAEDLAVKQGFPDCAKVIADTRYRIEQRAIRLAREEAAEAVRKKQQEELDYEMARIAAVEATL